jgi:hypothetical protein
MPEAMAAVTASSRTAIAVAAVRRWRGRLAAAAVLLAYPVWVLGYVYWYTLTSDLPGRRHGPQDAYRHTLASAVVAYTLSPRVVDWVTEFMEGSDPSSLMDRHNNAIGASIGAAAERFSELRPRVEARVQAGKINARDPQQVTWMPPRSWSKLPF